MPFYQWVVLYGVTTLVFYINSGVLFFQHIIIIIIIKSGEWCNCVSLQAYEASLASPYCTLMQLPGIKLLCQGKCLAPINY